MQNKEVILNMSNFFSEGMVLQMEKPLLIWGKDLPLMRISVLFKGKTYHTISRANGYWEIQLGKHQHGGPYRLQINGSSSKTIDDIYIGEVWLAGGQSNMELPIHRVYDSYRKEIDEANYPLIRQFQVPMTYNFTNPQEEIIEGSWISATQKHIQNFSALAFFYAKKLYEELGVPIGIIHTAVGGTPIEAWISEDTLRKLGGFEADFLFLKDSEKVAKTIKNDELRAKKWYEKLASLDKGLIDKPWYETDLNHINWKSIKLPQMFHNTPLENISGSIWFKKEFFIEDELLHDENKVLWLGTLIDSDDTFINGIRIGRTDYRYPPRKYKLDKNVLKKGKNILVVRLEVVNKIGGFIPNNFYGIKSKNCRLSFDDCWSYCIGAEMKQSIEPTTFFQYKPSGVYNAMIYPLKKYPVRGFLFYQGESNTGKPARYAEYFEALINDWRNLWREKLPFYFIQLANYTEPTVLIDDRKWAELRFQQSLISRDVDNTGMVSAIDVGIENELHPPDKKTLGNRLANWALDEIYSIPTSHKNPEIEEIQKYGNQYVLSFGPSVKQLKLINGTKVDIELLDKNNKWHSVNSIIEQNKIIVSFNNEDEYQEIRYAWRNNPSGILLEENSELPILPFKLSLTEIADASK